MSGLCLGWDNFVNMHIYLWEKFYTQWVEDGNELLLIYYEHVGSEKMAETLRNVSNYLKISLEEGRLACILKHPFEKFRRKGSCLQDNVLNPPKRFNLYTYEYVARNKFGLAPRHTKRAYTKQHMLKINSAIRRLKASMIKRGFDTDMISTYENTDVKITTC